MIKDLSRITLLLILITINFAYSQTYPGKIGVGLGGLGSVGLSAEYVNVVPTVSWSKPDFSGNAVATDANGWPTENFDLNVFDARPFNAWFYPGQAMDDPAGFVPSSIFGAYVFSWQGQATVQSFSDGSTTFNGPFYNSATNTSVLTVNWNNQTCNGGAYNCAFFLLRFTNTTPTTTGSNLGIKNLRIIRPGYPTNTTQLFGTTYLNAISPFSTLRFMDLSHANNSPQVNWSDRQLVDYYPYKKGMPWEHIIALANMTGKDIWINIPHMATDAYVTSLANLIKSSLRSDINIYLEYSNEVWNWQFSQATYNDNQANNGPDDQDVRTYVTTAIGINGSTGKPWENLCRVVRVAKRIVQIGQIFSSVLGTPITPTGRLRPVLAWQLGGYRPEYQTALQYIRNVWAIPTGKNVNNYIYAVASAPYFNDAAAASNATPQ